VKCRKIFFFCPTSKQWWDYAVLIKILGYALRLVDGPDHPLILDDKTVAALANETKKKGNQAASEGHTL